MSDYRERIKEPAFLKGMRARKLHVFSLEEYLAKSTFPIRSIERILFKAGYEYQNRKMIDE